MVSPDILGVKAEYSAEVAKDYNELSNKEIDKTLKESKQSQTEVIADLYYKKLYEDPKVTTSKTNFLQLDKYTGTNFEDKTDTYINMNSSYRMIKYNINGAGDKYNQLVKLLGKTGSAIKDSAKEVFANIKTRLSALGYDKIYKAGSREANTFAQDKDFMYALGTFQADMQRKGLSTSRADFRVGAKTLTALLQDNNTSKETATQNKEEVTKETKKEVAEVKKEIKKETPIVKETIKEEKKEAPKQEVVISKIEGKKIAQIPVSRKEVAPQRVVIPSTRMEKVEELIPLETVTNNILALIQADQNRTLIPKIDFQDPATAEAMKELNKEAYQEIITKEVKEKIDLYFSESNSATQKKKAEILRRPAAEVYIVIKKAENKYETREERALYISSQYLAPLS